MSRLMTGTSHICSYKGLSIKNGLLVQVIFVTWMSEIVSFYVETAG